MANMNRCCRDANNYLKKSELTNIEELRLFIDNFNVRIENYSTNGLSSFLLGCVELCLKLSDTIGYTVGEAKTRWLKGNILSLGGQYKNALKSYNCCLKLLDKSDGMYSDVLESCALNLSYIGDLSGAINLLEDLMISSNSDEFSNVLSVILRDRDENELSLSMLNRNENLNNFVTLQIINRLVDLKKIDEAWDLICNLSSELGQDNLFLVGYTASIVALITVKRGETFDPHNIPLILNKLHSHKSFFHYIDGLLNIAEVYILNNEFDKSATLLGKIIKSKKELTTLDIRIYKLLEITSIKRGDYKLAHDCSSKIIDIIKSTNSYDINKSLRNMSSYLYQEQLITS
jgi:tetratricopeptide (TPR) repeat protein